MGIRSMVQFTVRVAAFAAVAALLLQISCMAGLPAVTTLQIETHGDAGCHESAPPAPNAPDSSHICCSGDHSPDALLTAVITPVPLVSDPGVLDLSLALRFFASPSADFLASFSPPHRVLALRI
jgi:hypothetical protein